MIIKLGHRQLMAVRDAGTDRHRELVDCAEQIGKNVHAVNMPAVAWRALIDPLTERAFNRFGEWSSKRPGYGSALRRVRGLVLSLEMHPAYVAQVQIADGSTAPLFEGFAAPWAVGPYPPGDLVVLEPTPQVIQIDIGTGPVEMNGVVWRARAPQPSDRILGLWIDAEDHEGWG